MNAPATTGGPIWHPITAHRPHHFSNRPKSTTRRPTVPHYSIFGTVDSHLSSTTKPLMSIIKRVLIFISRRENDLLSFSCCIVSGKFGFLYGLCVFDDDDDDVGVRWCLLLLVKRDCRSWPVQGQVRVVDVCTKGVVSRHGKTLGCRDVEAEDDSKSGSCNNSRGSNKEGGLGYLERNKLLCLFFFLPSETPSLDGSFILSLDFFSAFGASFGLGVIWRCTGKIGSGLSFRSACVINTNCWKSIV